MPQAVPGSEIVTQSDLKEALQSFARTLVEEMRKPTPEELAKREEETAKAERVRREKIMLARTESQAKACLWGTCDCEQVKKRCDHALFGEACDCPPTTVAHISGQCDHHKPDGRSAVVGQKHSDGLVHPLCLNCQKLFDPISPIEAYRRGIIAEV